jgi:hypothetical protein
MYKYMILLFFYYSKKIDFIIRWTFTCTWERKITYVNELIQKGRPFFVELSHHNQSKEGLSMNQFTIDLVQALV